MHFLFLCFRLASLGVAEFDWLVVIAVCWFGFELYACWVVVFCLLFIAYGFKFAGVCAFPGYVLLLA